MRRSLILMTISLLSFATSALGRESVPIPQRFEVHPSDAPEPAGERADTLFLFAASGPGSYGSPGTDARGFTFDHAGGPAEAGWIGVDQQLEETFWQLAGTELCAGTGTDMSEALPFDAGDTVNDHALWCGSLDNVCDPNNYDGGNAWIDPDGYGDNWHQFAVLDLGDQSGAESITASFAYRTDYEGGDYDYLELSSLQAGEWQTHWSDQRTGDRTFREAEISILGTELDLTDLRLAFYFHSDGAWSDEDGNYLSDLGAAWLDNVRITADGQEIFAADFEDGLLPPELSFEVPTTAGDFAELYEGLFQGVADPMNESFVWALFDDQTPSQGAPGYDFGIAQGPPYLENKIQSPPLSVDADGQPLVLTADTQILLAFDVYLDLPLDESVFYSWDVKPVLSDSVECLGSFTIEQVIYFGTQQAWQAVVHDATLLVHDWAHWQIEGVEALVAELYVLDLAGIYGAAGEVRNQAPYFDNVRVMIVEGPTAAETAPSAPVALTAHPNPFNPKTTLSCSLAVPGHVQLHVYDLSGRRLRTLLDGPLDAGTHDIEWDGRDDAGRRLASGVYFVRFESGKIRQEAKLVLLK